MWRARIKNMDQTEARNRTCAACVPWCLAPCERSVGLLIEVVNTGACVHNNRLEDYSGPEFFKVLRAVRATDEIAHPT